MQVRKHPYPLFPHYLLITILCFSLLQGYRATTIPNFDLNTDSLVPTKSGFTLSGATIQATSEQERRQAVVKGAGDVDGDGFDDIIIGIWTENSNQGAIYVVYGSTTSSLSDLDLTTLNPSTTGFKITGEAAGDCFGFAVSTAGDINNDGYADIIIGAPSRNNNRGAAYIVYGNGDRSLLPDRDLATDPLDYASTGIRILGYEPAANRFGTSVGTAGSVDGDEYDDVMVGATAWSNNRGLVHVFFGGENHSFAGLAFPFSDKSRSITLRGNAQEDFFGFSISSGKVDEDDCDDFIIGAFGSNSNQGTIYVIYGRPRPSFDLNLDMTLTPLIPGSTGFQIEGTIQGDMFGSSVSASGDINNDSYNDIITGASESDSQKGAAYVIYGGPRGSHQHITLSDSTSFIPGSTGFKITGELAGDRLGWSVSAAGHVNGDQYGDIIIGAPAKNGGKGEVYVVYGGEKASLLDITIPVPASKGFTVTGKTTGAWLGHSVDTAGDVNQDEFSDILAGALYPSSPAGTPGSVFVIHATCVLEHCSTCLSRSCQTCDLTYYFFQDSCVEYCPNPTYPSNGFCEACPDHCSSCISQTECLVCDQGYTISNSLCEECPLNCEICDNLTTCNKCKTPFLLYQSSCEEDCPDPTYPSNGVCENCPDHCASCASETNCLTCDEGYAVSDSLCKECPENCETCDDITTCNKCKDTYFLHQSSSCEAECPDPTYPSNNICEECPDHCSSCSSEALCLSCEQGYAISNGFCASCSDRCNICDTISTCNQCKEPYLLHQSSCETDCPDPTYPSNGVCQDCLDHCSSCSSGTDCLTCDQGYAISNFICEKCPSNCEKCNDINTCNQCMSPYVLDQNSCLSNCPAHKYSLNGKCEDCQQHCSSCSSDTVCITCDQGYTVSNSLCVSCPINCDLCSSLVICDQCTSPFLLYESWCMPSCPHATFASDGKCQSCPQHCSACTSNTICQACNPGYTLSNSICISPPTYPQSATTAAQTLQSSVLGVGGVVSVGSSSFPVANLVSGIVQNTRYMDLPVTDDLAQVYQSWQTDLINWDFPNFLLELDNFKSLPEVFAQYDLDSPFLANFWSTMMTVGLSLCILIFCIFVRIFIERSKFNKGLFPSILQKVIAGSMNFVIVSSYGCLDDILFYLILDTKTNPFNTAFSWASLLFGFAFTFLGILLMIFSIMKVKRYQKLKKEGLAKNDLKEFEDFSEKNKHLEVFYSDFNDSSLWAQCFLAILVLRNNLASLIITVLYQHSMMQSLLLIVMDGAMLLFLLFKKPLTTLRAHFFQYYFETITLIVHLCTFILSIQKQQEEPSKTLNIRVCTLIIYLNTALVTGATAYMGIDIHETVREKIQEWKQNKSQNNKTVHPIPEENLEAQNILASSQTDNFVTSPEQNPIEDPNSNREYYYLASRNQKNTNFNGIQPLQIFNSSMSVDQTFAPDTSNLINQQNDRSIEQMIPQRRLTLLKKRRKV